MLGIGIKPLVVKCAARVRAGWPPKPLTRESLSKCRPRMCGMASTTFSMRVTTMVPPAYVRDGRWAEEGSMDVSSAARVRAGWPSVSAANTMVYTRRPRT